MTKTQEIIDLVKTGEYRIESWPTKRGTAYELRKWNSYLGIWIKVSIPTICAKMQQKNWSPIIKQVLVRSITPPFESMNT